MLVGRMRVRKRPAAMLGSKGIEGARHGFVEIYGNALDEATSGYGDRLDIVYYEDKSVSIRDYGRGVPIGWNSVKNHWNWHIIFNELYGGGKYKDNQEFLKGVKDWSSFDETTCNYLYSVGLNGLGATATQYSSEFFNVESFRLEGKDIIKREMRFEEGFPIIDGKPVDLFTKKYNIKNYVEQRTKMPKGTKTGTKIHWKPDSAVFTEVDMGGDWLSNVCEELSGVTGLSVYFENRVTGEKTVYEGDGLENLLLKKTINQLENADEPDVLSMSTFEHGEMELNGGSFLWICKAKVAIVKTRKKVEPLAYHNSVKMGGAAVKGVELALGRFFKEVGKREKVRVEASDYLEKSGFIVSTYSNYMSVKGQTKDELDDVFIQDTVFNLVYNYFRVEYAKGMPVVKGLVEDVLEEARARIQVKEYAKQVRAVKKVKRAQTPGKFHTCKLYMKKKHGAELWLTEGDSAQTAVDGARDSYFQATLPVKGKSLNVAKASVKRILANEEVKNIFTLLETGMDIGHEDLFDIKKLRFDKVIIATDADVDGYQIRVLLFLLFYRLAPRLITEGHLFLAESPRFELVLKGGKKIYAKDDIERDKLLKEHDCKRINRFKGLGEVDADVLALTTVSPKTRQLIPITCDFESGHEAALIDALFGRDKYDKRKDIIRNALGEVIKKDLDTDKALLDKLSKITTKLDIEMLEEE